MPDVRVIGLNITVVAPAGHPRQTISLLVLAAPVRAQIVASYVVMNGSHNCYLDQHISECPRALAPPPAGHTSVLATRNLRP